MNPLSIFRGLSAVTLSPKMSFSLGAENRRTGKDYGAKSCAVAFTCTLAEALCLLAGAVLFVKMTLFWIRLFAAKRVKRKYKEKIRRLKSKKKK